MTTAPKSLVPRIFSAKCGREVALLTYSERIEGVENVIVSMYFEPTLTLASKNGVLMISPMKPKLCIPIGSKNRLKEWRHGKDMKLHDANLTMLIWKKRVACMSGNKA